MKEDVDGGKSVKFKHRDNITKNCTNKEGSESFISSGYFNIKRDVDQKAHRTMKVIWA